MSDGKMKVEVCIRNNYPWTVCYLPPGHDGECEDLDGPRVMATLGAHMRKVMLDRAERRERELVRRITQTEEGDR